MKSKQHHFSVELAVKVGVERATLMANIEYWLDWSKAHNKNVNDGYYWTYNSASAFAKLFPYMSKHTIGRHLKILEEDGFLISGVFNKAGYDRTKWYTTPDYLILQNCNMDIAESQNGSCTSATPIPYVNTDSKPDSKLLMSEEKISDSSLVIEHFNKICNTKYRKETKSHIENINGRLADGHSVEDLKRVIESKHAEWKDDPKMAQYIRPQTLFATGKFQGYLIASRTVKKITTANHTFGQNDYNETI